MTTTKETIEATAADLGLTMTAEFIPWNASRRADEKDPSLNWSITLHKAGRAFLTTDYSAGMGHAPSCKQGRMTNDERRAVEWECSHGRAARLQASLDLFTGGKPILPNLADVLYSLCSDADAIDSPTFEEWAENIGYDTDSRKAEAIYRACLEIALKLRAALGDDGLTKLREAVRDY